MKNISCGILLKVFTQKYLFLHRPETNHTFYHIMHIALGKGLLNCSFSTMAVHNYIFYGIEAKVKHETQVYGAKRI